MAIFAKDFEARSSQILHDQSQCLKNMPKVEQRDVHAEGAMDSDPGRLLHKGDWNDALESQPRRKRSRSESVSPSARTSRKIPQHRMVRHETFFSRHLTTYQSTERRSDDIPIDQNSRSFRTNSSSTSIAIHNDQAHSRTGTIRDETFSESGSNAYRDISKYKVKTNQRP